MEGYSVTEAASVLGVPTERVWELLARGVLAGRAEGEAGMRVFLQPRPAPAPPTPEPARGVDGGGNGGEESRELSPFRELLTEFRNLTERYGQALLALGEARGEVAALRSRVDLLEARMDLRLPTGSVGPAEAPPVGWAAPAAWPQPSGAPAPLRGPTPSGEPPAPEARPEPIPTSEPGAAADQARGPAAAVGAETESRPMRRAASIRAPDTFAEALARAHDPSVPELLREAEAGPSEPQPSGADEATAEATLPRELPPAEAVPVAEESSDVGTSVAAEVSIDEVATEEISTADEPAEGHGETESTDDEAVKAGSDVGSAPEAAEPDVEIAGRDATVQAEKMAEAEPIAEGPEAAEPAEPAWHSERYTAEVSDPDWWEAEAFPETSGVAEPPEPPEPPPPNEQPSMADAEEETLLWYGRSSVGQDDESPPETAEPRPLDPLAALEALSQSTPRADAPRGGETVSPPVEPQRERPWPASPRPVPPTTAGRAYRRLRRIFPG